VVTIEDIAAGCRDTKFCAEKEEGFKKVCKILLFLQPERNPIMAKNLWKEIGNTPIDFMT